MSGQNPGGHGIFGFIDRTLPDLSLLLPNAANRQGTSLWGELSRNHIPVIVMNVPVTYPPEQVNGVLIGGFLGVDVKKIAFPSSVSSYLEEKNYIIDADTSSALEKPDEFIEHLTAIIDQRFSIFKELIDSNPWRYAHLHIMETDRLFHFLWSAVDNKSDRLCPAIYKFFEVLDQHLTDIISHIDDDTEVLILSDHGFCASNVEWDLNAWLVENGYLKWHPHLGRGLHRMKPESIAYSLIPGRIYLNLKGRESTGSVDPTELEAIRQNLMQHLLTARQPDGATPVFEAVLSGADLFSGTSAFQAPDIVAVPAKGVELKSRLQPASIVQPARLKGMHTYENAMVWFRNGTLTNPVPAIMDLYSTILSYFGIVDPLAEGHVIATWPHST